MTVNRPIIKYDEFRDTVTVNGHEFSFEFFELFTHGNRDKVFEIYQKDGILRVRTFFLNNFVSFIIHLFKRHK